jgi:hypothetical protein
MELTVPPEQVFEIKHTLVRPNSNMRWDRMATGDRKIHTSRSKNFTGQNFI